MSFTFEQSAWKPLCSLFENGTPLLHLGRIGEDNLGYLLHTGPETVWSADCPDAAALTGFVKQRSLRLGGVLLTHTHHDHVAGLKELVRETGCELIAGEDTRDWPATRRVLDGERFRVDGIEVQAIDTSGHSEQDMSYWFPELNLCFCGDTWFPWGCGRMFAGPPERFWRSLRRLRDLPPHTRLLGGHDYIADNLQFLKQTFPDIPRYQVTMDNPEDARVGTVKEQREHNPFWRADDPALAKALDMPGAEPVHVFARTRELRNRL